jgi:trehalose 6-phosphate phosphatase
MQSWSTLADIVKAELKDYPKLKLTQGRMVFEIRPTIKWDKGKALEFLLESLGFADCTNVLPVYIGDDRTDEDAFKVLRKRGQGIGILVSKYPKDTNASYSLQEPAEVMTTPLAFLSIFLSDFSSQNCQHVHHTKMFRFFFRKGNSSTLNK